MKDLRDLVQYYVNEELGIGMYVVPYIYISDLLYNYNDLCDMLDLNDVKRRNWLKNIPENSRVKITFDRGNDGESTETFISTFHLIEVLNRYGQEMLDMLQRKNSVENFIYSLSKQFEDEFVVDNEYSMADKFVLGSIMYDSNFTHQANKNLAELLKRNETMETIFKYQPNIEMEQEKIELEKQIKEFTKLVQQEEECLNKLNETISVCDIIKEITSCPIRVIEEYEDDEI